jgi:FAD/FMN-containing dehydrogenase
MTDVTADLERILGPKGWLTGDDVEPYGRDWLNRYGVPPLGVARPASTEETAAVISICQDAGLPVTPQGGNTSLCGAAVLGPRGGVILSLSRMNALGRPDRAAATVEVEAGVVLANLHAALAAEDLIFPMHLGAEGSAQIGGLIGTNAGGSHALRYGMMQDLVVGLEVVLPDGTIWDGLRAVQKDNAGYQLKRLFCGAEGTLGVVTRAVLKLFPAPKQTATALLAIADETALVDFGTHLRGDVGEFISGLEFFSDLGLSLALKHVEGLDFPLESRSSYYLLVELTASSALVPLDDILEAALTTGMESGQVIDGALAMSEAQRATFWRLREEQPEGQRLEGEQLKHDISIPPGRLAEFLKEGPDLCSGILEDVRINPFGHLGDGNVHYNLSPPDGAADFAGLGNKFAEDLATLAGTLRGSFAAEHGLGRAKIGLADTLRSQAERSLMARIKSAIDPQSIMNPGVVVRDDQQK